MKTFESIIRFVEMELSGWHEELSEWGRVGRIICREVACNVSSGSAGVAIPEEPVPRAETRQATSYDGFSREMGGTLRYPA